MHLLVDNGQFYIWDEKTRSWSNEFLIGIDLGLGLPGAAPSKQYIQKMIENFMVDEFKPSKEQILRWLSYIEELGIHYVRLYGLWSYHFYDALYEFNGRSNVKKPIMIFQVIVL